MTSLINRYVAAVKRHILTDDREDIARELRSSLVDELDELEAESGEPIDDHRIAEVIRRRGHPMQVAASYRGKGMIGPTTYVYYMQLLKAGAVVIFALVLAQALFGGQPIGPRILLNALHDAYWAGILFFTWLTVLCAAFDSWIDRGNFFRKWHPSRLQPVPHVEVRASAGVAVWDLLVATALFGFLSSGAIFESTLLNTRDDLVIAAAPALSWLTLSVQIALFFVAVIALLNFVHRYWACIKLLPYIAAHVVAALGLAVLILHPQGLVIGAGDVPAAYSMSALYTLKILLALCALRAAAIVFEGISDFRRLRLKDERPVAV
jgi:hypothetical protein